MHPMAVVLKIRFPLVHPFKNDLKLITWKRGNVRGCGWCHWVRNRVGDEWTSGHSLVPSVLRALSARNFLILSLRMVHSLGFAQNWALCDTFPLPILSDQKLVAWERRREGGRLGLVPFARWAERSVFAWGHSSEPYDVRGYKPRVRGYVYIHSSPATYSVTVTPVSYVPPFPRY